MIDRETLIQDIYEAAALPEHWPRVLEQIGSTVGTRHAVIGTGRSDAWFGWTASKPFEPVLAAYLKSDIATTTQITPRLLAADHAGFLRQTDVMTNEEWEADSFRRDLSRHFGMNHAAATAVQLPSADSLVVHVQRPEGQPSLSDREIATLDSFRPHLARAGLLATRWRLKRLSAATEALALVGLPAAVVDRDSRVLAANDLIERMAHVRWMARGRLGLVDGHAQGLLQKALTGLFEPFNESVQSFASRVGQTDAAVIHVVPTSGQSRDLFDGGLAVLVVTPVTAPDAPDAQVIRALFDLSPSEARVARSLTRGQTIDQIADGSGVTRETVRSQVKAVMAKTGTTRQAEVAALLAGLPKLRTDR
jgi:DNA-binding CsgD family transcriptional regulator